MLLVFDVRITPDLSWDYLADEDNLVLLSRCLLCLRQVSFLRAKDKEIPGNTFSKVLRDKYFLTVENVQNQVKDKGKDKKMKKKKWLVSVLGYDSNHHPPQVVASKVISLKEDETPVDWFLSRPRVYFRFEFTPVALINFWPIK